MVKHDIAKFLVLPTDAKWFGATYKEDKEQVRQSIQQPIWQAIILPDYGRSKE